MGNTNVTTKKPRTLGLTAMVLVILTNLFAIPAANAGVCGARKHSLNNCLQDNQCQWCENEVTFSRTTKKCWAQSTAKHNPCSSPNGWCKLEYNRTTQQAYCKLTGPLNKRIECAQKLGGPTDKALTKEVNNAFETIRGSYQPPLKLSDIKTLKPSSEYADAEKKRQKKEIKSLKKQQEEWPDEDEKQELKEHIKHKKAVNSTSNLPQTLDLTIVSLTRPMEQTPALKYIRFRFKEVESRVKGIQLISEAVYYPGDNNPYLAMAPPKSPQGFRHVPGVISCDNAKPVDINPPVAHLPSSVDISASAIIKKGPTNIIGAGTPTGSWHSRYVEVVADATNSSKPQISWWTKAGGVLKGKAEIVGFHEDTNDCRNYPKKGLRELCLRIRPLTLDSESSRPSYLSQDVHFLRLSWMNSDKVSMNLYNKIVKSIEESDESSLSPGLNRHDGPIPHGASPQTSQDSDSNQ